MGQFRSRCAERSAEVRDLLAAENPLPLQPRGKPYVHLVWQSTGLHIPVHKHNWLLTWGTLAAPYHEGKTELHHIDEDPLNPHPRNLLPLTMREHVLMHP